MSVPHHSDLAPSTDMTFEAWIKPAVGGKSQTVAALGSLGWRVMLLCGGDAQTCCGSHEPNAVGFWMGENPTGVTAGQECAQTPSSTAGVSIGEWNHIAVKVIGGANSVTFVINGVEINTVVHNGVTIADGGASDGGLTFGYLFPCNCLRFDGYIDGVRIWNDLRSLPEIQMHKDEMMTTSMPGYANLVAAYDVSAMLMGAPPDAFLVLDQSVNARHATRDSVRTHWKLPSSSAAFNFEGGASFDVPYAAALAPSDALTFEAGRSHLYIFIHATFKFASTRLLYRSLAAGEEEIINSSFSFSVEPRIEDVRGIVNGIVWRPWFVGVDQARNSGEGRDDRRARRHGLGPRAHVHRRHGLLPRR